MKKLALTYVALAFASILLALNMGCRNTAHGAGQDIERMGDKIQEKTR
jgi:predicted small secreted protein